MIIKFKCACGEHFQTGVFQKAICPKCGKDLCPERNWEDEQNKHINLCGDGDPQGFYSPDLGIYIEGPQHLKKVLKSRGMECLTDSKEYRDKWDGMRERSQEKLSREGKI